MGNLANRSSQAYTSAVNNPEASPAAMPTTNAMIKPSEPRGTCAVTGKIGPAPISGTRNAPATAEAIATGINERGRHSNNNNSTASKTAATGEAKIADIPPAAPAT